ncbi:MAG: hypothetical protein H6813_04180 [Phycisphaeraceae bacterium]|nr:hypothetical protein [Phycisphaeraceae bacterium]MCB9847145.1 hypothetical protein [Phycisphaeraceae bacterium]
MDERTEQPDRFDDERFFGAEDGGGGDSAEPYDVDERAEPDSESTDSRGDDAGAEPEADPKPQPEPSRSAKKPAGKPVRERIESWRRGAAGEGEALSREGALGWRFYVIMSAGALVAAVVLAIMNTNYAEDATFWQKLGPGSRESLRALLRAPIHLGVGMLAFALTAWGVGVRAGRGDLAAARIGLSVSLAIMALEIRWSFPGERIVVYLLAFALYFLTVMLSFRKPPRVAGTLIVLHIGLFAAIAGLGWLIVWVGM